MSRPRKHHFVPQFYLGGFTPSGTKEDKLHVLDAETRKQWLSSPADVACERDFYMLELDDAGDPAALEKLWSRIEEGGAAAIRFIIDNGRLPNGDGFHKLIEFMALTSVRVPASINAVNQPWEHIGKVLLHQATESRERWEQIVADLKAKGHDVSDVTWESMREFVRSDDYTIRTTQNARMQSILHMLDTMVPLLFARQWTVVKAPTGGPYFICSDRPLTLDWIGDRGGGFYSPGFGLPGTLVVFPVNKSIALFGLFEAQKRPSEIGTRDIATCNTLTSKYANRFIYSTEADFVLNFGNGRIVGKLELLALTQPKGNVHETG